MSVTGRPVSNSCVAVVWPGCAMVHRANHRQPMGLTREQREVFRDRQTRHIRRDRPEFPAHAIGCVGLQIPRFLLGRAAPHEKENACLGVQT